MSAQQLRDVLFLWRVHIVRQDLLQAERKQTAIALSSSQEPEAVSEVLRLTATLAANAAEEHQLSFKFSRAYFKGVSLYTHV